jgi:hypothetical protein
MPKDFPSAVSAQIVAQNKRPALLYELGIAGTTLYYTDSKESLVFAGRTYTHKAIAISQVEQSAEGQINGITVQFDNTTRDMAAYAILDTFENKPLVVKRIYLDAMSGSTLYNEYFRGEMETPSSIDQSWLKVKANSGQPLYKRAMIRQYQKSCNNLFGDENCNAGWYSDLNSIANLIGYWPLDALDGGVALDRSGYGNNGTPEGGTDAGDIYPGVQGNCFVFNGRTSTASDRIDCGNASPLINIGYGSFTISYWCRLKYVSSAASGTTGCPVSKFVSPDLINCRFASNAPSFIIVKGAVSKSGTFTDLALQTNDFAWHHYVFVVDRSDTLNGGSEKVYCYKDGVLSATTIDLTGLAYNATNTGNVSIGGTGSGYLGIQGYVDDVRIYNRALTPGEVLKIYNYIGRSIVPGLVGYWSANEATGTTAYDLSGNANNITLIGGVTRASGKFGTGSLHFDGSARYGSAGAGATLNTTTQLSVAFWTRMDHANSAIPTDSEYFLAKASGNAQVPANFSYRVNIMGRGNKNLDYISFALSTGGVSLGTSSAASLVMSSFALNTWYHLAATWNGVTMQIYRDGQEVSTVSRGFASTVNSLPAAPLYVGVSQPGVNGMYLDGDIDDLRLWSRGLTPTEVLTVYNIGSPGLYSHQGIASGHTPPMTTCGKVRTGSTNYFTDPSMSAQVGPNSDDYWNFGTVRIGKSGTTYTRVVDDYVSGTSRVSWTLGLPVTLDSTYRYEIQKGCPRTMEACSGTYSYGPYKNNSLNFGGFVHIGRSRDKLTTI